MKSDTKSVLVVLALIAGAIFVGRTAFLADKAVVEPVLEQTNTANTNNVVEETVEVIDLSEAFIVVSADPVVFGTAECRWYGEIGLDIIPDSETTCTGNTCFLLVHNSNVDAGIIMLAWISAAREEGRDPRKENVELSVFTFMDGKSVDHITYFPKRDVFEAY